MRLCNYWTNNRTWRINSPIKWIACSKIPVNNRKICKMSWTSNDQHLLLLLSACCVYIWYLRYCMRGEGVLQDHKGSWRRIDQIKRVILWWSSLWLWTRTSSAFVCSSDAIPEENHSKSLPNENKNYSIDSGGASIDDDSHIMRPLLGNENGGEDHEPTAGITIVPAAGGNRRASDSSLTNVTPPRRRTLGNGRVSKPSPLTALLSKSKRGVNGGESSSGTKQTRFTLSNSSSSASDTENDEDYGENDKLSWEEWLFTPARLKWPIEVII